MTLSDTMPARAQALRGIDHDRRSRDQGVIIDRVVVGGNQHRVIGGQRRGIERDRTAPGQRRMLAGARDDRDHRIVEIHMRAARLDQFDQLERGLSRMSSMFFL